MVWGDSLQLYLKILFIFYFIRPPLFPNWPLYALSHTVYTPHPSFWSTLHTPLGGNWLLQIFSSRKKVIQNNSNTNHKIQGKEKVVACPIVCLWRLAYLVHFSSNEALILNYTEPWLGGSIFYSMLGAPQDVRKESQLFTFLQICLLPKNLRGGSPRLDGKMGAQRQSSTSQAGLTPTLRVGGRQAAGGVPKE